MSKIIQSPIKKFPGSVTLIDPVPYPAFIEWEKALRSEGEAKESIKQISLFAGVKAMVEKWEIDNFDINNPPATPRTPVLKLLSWLIDEIVKVIDENEDVSPNQ